MSNIQMPEWIDKLEPESRRQIRHELGTGLAFVDASFKNLSGKKPNPSKAMSLFNQGAARLRKMIADLDTGPNPTIQALELGYNGTKESMFTSQHPDVLQWTEYFQKRAGAYQIFERFSADNPIPSEEKARVVGVCWHKFSDLMPWLICQSAALVATNEQRHYVVQTAFEELGMRDVRAMHPDLFWDCAKVAGASDEDHARFGETDGVHSALKQLKKALLDVNSHFEVLGLLLGLELPAEENIRTVYESLAHSDSIAPLIKLHPFFQLHFQIEVEHVRLTVANFLRFCQDDASKAKFVQGFDHGIQFWNSFWGSMSQNIRAEQMAVEAHV